MTERRNIDYQSWDELLTDVQQLSAGYEQLGNWSLGQACSHLASALEKMNSPASNGKPWLFRRIVGPIARRRVFSTRRFPDGVKAPPTIEAGDPAEDAAAIDRLSKAVANYQQYTGPVPEHPFFGKLSRAQWDEFHLLHSSHHLSLFLPAAKNE